MTTVAAAHLHGLLDAIRDQRQELDREEAMVRRWLAELEAGSPPPPTRSVERPAGTPHTVRAVALQAIEGAERGTEVALLDVVAAVEAAGIQAQYASVSSMLSRIAKETGLIRKGSRRGTYVVVAHKSDREEFADPGNEELIPALPPVDTREVAMPNRSPIEATVHTADAGDRILDA